jgi:peptidoglycan/xylan/chitin deacetylase (PgdA/CDA1 family)
MLTWDQIVEISNSGIECGAHTQSHPKLDMLPLAMAGNEIRRSKDLLEQHLGQQVTSFSYPYGFYTSGVRRLVKEAGFTSACAVNDAMCSDRADHFALDRLMVLPNMDISAFNSLITQEVSSQLKEMMRAHILVRQMLHYCRASISRFYLAVRGYSYEEV